ncbi:ATP-binding protein, partial [Patescibacteria group bacterium]|nr:ATP-binding protein [Patescibacteria group bacterium]MBU1783352.1 ATP-binding protein [Patescibacteria group bacterium]
MNIIRDITLKAQKYLANPEIMLFVGPRQAGKTTILKQLQFILEKETQNIYFLNLEELEYLELLNQSPKNIFKIFNIDLNKKNYIFIDEIQYLKNPSNFLKYFYDEYQGKIKLLVSGSSAFYIDKKFKDSLAGRKKIFYVFTLSFKEFLRFKNEDILSQKNFQKLSLKEKEKISFYYQEYIVYGGYPRVVLAPLQEKEDLLREIAFSYIKKDIYESGIKQEEIFYRLFKILSSQIGNLVNSSELSGTLGVSKIAIDNYLYVMQKSFHICLLRPFFKNIRKELSKMPKIYFYDLGLRNFFIRNFNSFIIREDKGGLLENAVFCQLKEKYDEELLKFWRTIQKNEIDFVCDEKEAYEVKVNPKEFKEKKYQIFLKNYKN